MAEQIEPRAVRLQLRQIEEGASNKGVTRLKEIAASVIGELQSQIEVATSVS